ncbi:MAG: hypothetical protein CM1200mP10_03240 [Candidatus Neomarinimicrobiota bacterium]|nr:MAG: hypothetical protein CM1200mP10_03240 [Candidatus Neomarinimicrobiota bacterium]
MRSNGRTGKSLSKCWACPRTPFYCLAYQYSFLKAEQGVCHQGAGPILKKKNALPIKSNFALKALNFEFKVEHFRKLTTAKVVKTPFFDPERKRSARNKAI